MIIPKIVDCARCGGEHFNLQLRELPGEPIGDACFWTECPTTKAPILIAIRQTEDL